MGTPGFFGVKINGDIKISYSRFDSLPEFMGLSMFRAAQRIASDYDNYRNKIASLQLVNEYGVVPTTIRKRLERLRSTDTTRWGTILKELDSDLLGLIDAGFMLDCVDKFYTDTSWVWSWVINCDDHVLDCWCKKINAPPVHDRSGPVTRIHLETIRKIDERNFIEYFNE